ncbi:hypothetical protein ALQ52_04421 [Pseudomonas cannabina pv. alisalensis]|nr:hypothetical protein ALQ52_04421 [Pseudomonas cannabina pv. alisalensis]
MQTGFGTDQRMAFLEQMRTIAAHGFGIARLAAQLEQLHPVLQQRLAIRRITAMHGGHIGGLQRIGQQTDLDAGISTPRQVQQTFLARHKVGGDQHQLLARVQQLRGQLRGQQQVRIRLALRQHFGRRIPQRLVVRPDQFVEPGFHAWLSLVRHQPLIKGLVLLMRLLQRIIQFLAGLRQVLAVRQEIHEVADRLAERAIPVLIETVPQLFGDRPDAQHVDIGEIQVRLGIEILVTQVASANDCDAAVSQPQLVVHAPVLTRQVHQAPQAARDAGLTPEVLRVEQPNLDVRMRRQRGNRLVQPVAGGVVQQDAHANATVSRLEQLIDQRACAQAVVDDVVLQVEAAFGVADQFGARLECITAVRQQAKTRAPLVRHRHGLDRTAKRRARGWHGLAWLAGDLLMCATADAQGNQQAKGQGP